MPRGRQCGVCANPEAVIKCDALMAAGVSLAEAAAALNVSKFCVSRHKRHSTLQLADDEALEVPEDRLETLYFRCEDLYKSLAATGNVKAASDVLKIQARLAEQAVQRQEAKQQASTTTAASDEWPTPQQIDNVKRKVKDCYQSQIERGMVWCPVCQARPVDPAIALQRIRALKESHDDNSSAVAN